MIEPIPKSSTSGKVYNSIKQTMTNKAVPVLEKKSEKESDNKEVNNVNVKIFFLNIRSANNKGELLVTETDHKCGQVDVICLAEHWANEIHKLPNLSNFRLATTFARKNKRGGGVCSYVLPTIVSSELDLFSKLTEEEVFETSTIVINKVDNIKLDSPIYLVTVYRNPKSDFEAFLEKLEKLLDQLIETNSLFLVVGDFNVHMCDSTCKNNIALRELISAMDLALVVQTGYTRQGKKKNTLIDNCITNIKDTNYNIVDSTLSDHKGILFSIKLMGETTKRKLTRRVNPANYAACLDDVNDLLVQNQEISFEKFHQKLQEKYNKHFPLREARKWAKKDELTYEQGLELGKLLEDKFHYYELYKHYKAQAYKRKVNFVNKKIKKFMYKIKVENYDRKIKDAVANNKTREIWKTINNETKTSKIRNDIGSLKIADQSLEDPNEIVNALNNFFCNVSNKYKKSGSAQKADNYLRDDVGSSFSFVKTNAEEVTNFLKDLNKDAATGLDDIPGKFLLNDPNYFGELLTHYINRAIEEEYFPDSLKEAKITPIHKKGARDEPDNYRPIAVLPFISKPFEKVLYKQIVGYFEKNNLFSQAQYGFRKGKSTGQAVSEMVEQLLQATKSNKNKGSEKESIVSLQIDLSKAFDLVDHNILLHKLKKYGFSKAALNLLASYLSQRTQKTVVTKNGQTYESSSECNGAGIPQGSILGALLFLIYINDLPDAIKGLGLESSTVLYADDINIILRGRNIKGKIIKLLDKIEKWMIANNLQINFEKTLILNFTPEIEKFDHVEYDNYKIPTTQNLKYLGFQIDSKLNWTPHVQQVKTLLASKTYALKQLVKRVKKETAINYYHAHINSVISYGLHVWGYTSSLEMILICQKRALRILDGKPNRFPCKSIFTKYKLMTVFSQYFFTTIKEATKLNIINKDKIKSKYGVTTRNTFIKQFDKDKKYQKHSLEGRSIAIFNKLPEAIKKLLDKENSSAFIQKTKGFFIENPFYSFKEFFMKVS